MTRYMHSTNLGGQHSGKPSLHQSQIPQRFSLLISTCWLSWKAELPNSYITPFNWEVYKINSQALRLQNVKNSIRDVKSTGQNPGFQRAICTTGEQPIVLADINLHDSSSNAPKYGLLSMLTLKRMNQAMTRQPPDFYIAFCWTCSEVFLTGIQSQSLYGWVVCLEGVH